MAGLPNYFLTSLAQTLNVGGNDTTIQLSTIMTIDGQTITTSDFAQYGRGIITINPLTTASLEFASFTGINPALGANGGVTGVLRGLSFKGNNQIAGNQKFNPIGTPVLISFGTHNLLDIPALAGTNAFTGLNTFSVSPTVPTGGTGTQAANNQDIANAISGSSGTATNIVYGTVKLSVAAASAPAPIVVGTNDPRVPPSPGTSGGIVGYTSTTAVASSVLLTQHAIVIGGGAGATPTPLASLGTSTQVLHGAAAGDPTFGAVSLTADVTGTLPIGNGGTGGTSGALTSVKNGTTTKNTVDASGSQTIAHGGGATPKYVRILAIAYRSTATAALCQAQTVYNGTTQSSQSFYFTNNTPTVDQNFSLNIDASATGVTVGVITFDATNITITWTKTNTSTGTYQLLWEAFF